MFANFRPELTEVAEIPQIADPGGDLFRQFRVWFADHYLIPVLANGMPNSDLLPVSSSVCNSLIIREGTSQVHQ